MADIDYAAIVAALTAERDAALAEAEALRAAQPVRKTWEFIPCSIDTGCATMVRTKKRAGLHDNGTNGHVRRNAAEWAAKLQRDAERAAERAAAAAV